MNKPGKFDAIVIIATMRSGSNLLERTLSQHPKIVAQSELFNPNFIGRAGHDQFDGFSLEAREKDPYTLLKYLLVKFENKIPVFRYFNDHQSNAFDAILDNPRIAKILLKRNPIDSFISFSIARETQSWLVSRRKPEKGQYQVKIEFDPSLFQLWHETAENFYTRAEARLEQTGQSYYTIYYDNIKNIDELNDIGAFLGLEERFEFLFEPIKRQNPNPRESYLTNPEVLESLKEPIWPSPRSQTTRARPVVPFGYLASNLDLIYVPLAGNGTNAELDVLQKANLKALEKIESSTIAPRLRTNPKYTIYTRVIDPRHRIYTIFMQHLYGETNAFDCDFVEFIRNKMNVNIQRLPTEKSEAGLKAVGIMPRKIPKIYRDFVVNIRKELWSGFRNHLLSEEYWPQCMLVENLKQHFDLTIIKGKHFPDSEDFEALQKAEPIEDEFLYKPICAHDFLDKQAGVQIFDLYQEDIQAYGFEIEP